MKNATGLERFTGSTATEACLTLIGALSGNPIAALLPVLNNSLAAARQKVRVEEALRDIESTLGTHSELLHNLSDAQYQLVNESILAVLQTTSAEKIRYLRNAVHNSLFASGIPPQEAIVLARRRAT